MGRAHSIHWIPAVAALAIAAGCYDPDVSTGLVCDEDGNCPDGQSCRTDGTCGFDDEPEPISCDQTLPCASPPAGKIGLCGQLTDLSDSTAVNEQGIGLPCDPSDPAPDGACAIDIDLVDGLELVEDPAIAGELNFGELAMDDCGRFQFLAVEPQSGFVALVTTDDDAAIDADHTEVATIIPVTLGERVEDIEAFVLEQDDDEAWASSSTAPLPNNSFADVGATVGIFRHRGQPVTTVSLTIDGQATALDETFYFSDDDPTQRTSLQGSDSTGPNGTVIHINEPQPAPHSGTFNEPDGCAWPIRTMATPPGLITVAVYDAVITGSSDLCP